MTKKNKIIIGSIIGVLLCLFLLLLFLKYHTTYTINFDNGNGDVTRSIKIKKDGIVERPIDPVKDGYVFLGWYYNNELFDFNSKVDGNITLVARWQAKSNDMETYTVKFDTDGGSVIANQVIKKGEKVTKPENPTKNGFEFKGWKYESKDYDFDQVVESDLTLVASWEQKSKTSSSSSTKPATNSQKPISSSSSKASSSKPKPSSSSTPKPSSSAPKPSSSAPKNNYTVIFNSDGGTSISSQTVIEGGKVTRPSNPTKAGYNFVNWLLNGSAYDFETPVTGNITLVASWRAKSYTVSAVPVDQYSPDRILKVYEDGTQISVSEIKYNGVTLCTGSNMVVNMYEIEGITSLTVILTNGTSVTASVN